MAKTLVQINVTANRGSTGKITEGIGSLAAAKGFQSIIAYGRSALPSKSELIRIGTKKDYLWHGGVSRLLDNHGLCSSNATAEFIRRLNKIKPDIVHLHNIHGYYLNYPLLFEYLKEAAIPVVWTLHDCWSFTGHCSHFDYIKCDKWETQCFKCPQKKSYPKSVFFDNSRRNYINKKHFFTSLEKMYVVTVSNWLREIVSRSFLKQHPVYTIKNGIDTDIFKPCADIEAVKARYGTNGKKVFLGVASTWDQRKGLNDFVQLAKMISDYIKIVLVGVSDRQARVLPNNIIAIPRTDSQADLAAIYSMADAFLNPTYEDTYPTTNLEAIASGTPVITYNTGGSAEVITAVTGKVVDVGNWQDMYKKALTMPKNVEACREYALKHFQQQDRFNEYIELYEKILEKKI